MSQSSTPPLTSQILKSLPIFNGLPDQSFNRLIETARQQQFSDGSALFFQGDPAEKIFILREGRVKLIQLTADGQQVLMRVATPGSLFGAVVMAMGKTYPVTALAAQESTVMFWSKTIWMDFLSSMPSLATNALHVMAGHIEEFQDRFRELATERVERRVARAILRLASQAGKKVPEGVLLNLPISRQDLAEMTGTTLFSVSRILSQWETQGLILSGREKIIIRFPHGLVRIAEDFPTDREDK